MQFIDLKKQYEVLKPQMDEKIAKVLDSAHYIGGTEVKELEQQLAEYVGVKHCLSCGNGTDALTLAMRCLDVKEGDAVFVPDFTFFASAEVVSLEKATPVFVDVDSRTFNISATSLEQAILAVKEEGKLNLKAIVVVDLFGQPADFEAIRKIADKYNMPIVEDGAQGFGGSINGKKACSFGDIATTSFFPAKPVGCYGDGGAIFTNCDEYYDLMKSLAVHGKGSDKYDNVRIGYNSRLDTIQAGILQVKLKAFKDYELESRNVVANRYKDLLSEVVATPLVLDGFVSSWAQYTVILNDGVNRTDVQAKLKGMGIPTMVYYPTPMHMETAFKGAKLYVECPNAEILKNKVMSIPMHPYLDENTQNEIINALIKVLDK